LPHTTCQPHMIRVVPLAAVWLTHVLGVTIAAWLNRQQINPDAVAYLRIAHYYWHGPSHFNAVGRLESTAELAHGPLAGRV